MRLPRILPIAAALLLAACDEKADPAAGLSADSPLAEIERRILENPNSAVLFAERARYHERVDSLDKALRDWRRAIELDTTNAALYQGLGDLSFRMLLVDEADRAFTKASQLDPRATMPLLRLSELRLLQRRNREAMELVNNVLRLDVHEARAYNLKGWIHLDGGDTALAVSSYRTAIEQDPYMIEPYLQLGALFSIHRAPIAVEYYRSALEIDPMNVEALYGMGMYAQEAGMDSVALANYDRIREIAPYYAHAWYNTGFILLEHQQDPMAARPYFVEAQRLAPDYSDAYYNVGVTYERTGQLDSAFHWYRMTLEREPEHELGALGLERLQAKGLRVGR